MSEKSNTTRANLSNEKKQLREHFKGVRKHLPQVRRDEAREVLWDYLEGRMAGAKKVLSFESMKYEVDLGAVNKILLQEGRLYLTKIEGDHLEGYRVKSGTREKEFDCILVPAIAFDEQLYRLGYGFGYYDRLLAKHPTALTIGIGFREQLSLTPLPTETHDQPVKELCLV